jgi:hypothetical protein
MTVLRPTPLARLLDLDRYPLDRRDDPAVVAAIDDARSALEATGCAIVRGLVSSAGVAALDNEITERKQTTHYSTEVMNPYFHTTPDPAFPAHHPVNTFIERSSGFIAGDAWGPVGAMNSLFRAAPLTRFVAACLDLDELHCYADPLAGLTANILEPGQQFTWHFDTNDFAVTVLVAESDAGGLFEYVPDIRSDGDEGFDRIQAVLDDDPSARQEVTTLDLRPGDMQIFRGRNSLHRVTRVPAGSATRHAAIFAYTAEAGVIGRVERTRQLFGRVLDEHVAAEAARVRGDALLD